jgi:hypothetical protein
MKTIVREIEPKGYARIFSAGEPLSLGFLPTALISYEEQTEFLTAASIIHHQSFMHILLRWFPR